MKVTVALEQRFVRQPDGRVFSPGGTGLHFWNRYLDVFDGVDVLARVQDVETVPRHYELASSLDVGFFAVPHYVGLSRLTRDFLRVRQAIREGVAVSDSLIARLPGVVGSIATRAMRRSGRPYGLEIVADPLSSVRAARGGSPLGRVGGRIGAALLRDDVRHACAVSYVTGHALQQQYPAAHAFATSYSSVEIRPEEMRKEPRIYTEPASRIVSVGTMEVPYKGFDTLIDAVARIPEISRPHLTVIGDGRMADYYRKLVVNERCAGHVTFRGHVSGRTVRESLDEADLFVLASRSEGLPRSMIEAMARGLPCIGTDVGGVPELLDSEMIVRADDAQQLSARLVEALEDPTLMSVQSRRNLEKAATYRSERLVQRRKAMYATVRRFSEQASGSTYR